MELSPFVLRVAAVALPGLAAWFVYRRLRGPSKCASWEQFAVVFLFSAVSYATYAVIASMWGPTPISVLQSLEDPATPLNWAEIGIVTLLSVPIAFIASGIHRFKTFNKIGQLARVTHRYGDEDVWEFFFNLQDFEWVFVRDHKLNLVYYGYPKLFSESDHERELLLTDVQVFDNGTGTYLYECELLYACRCQHDLTVEVPQLELQRRTVRRSWLWKMIQRLKKRKVEQDE